MSDAPYPPGLEEHRAIAVVDLMTDAEHKAMEMTAELFNHISQHVIGSNEVARSADIPELAMHIHDLQRMIMSQAACRAFPNQYRLLGEVIQKDV